MSIAQELQNAVADVSAAIAAKKTYGRAELEVLRRRLTEAQRDAGRLERAETRARAALDQLVDGIDARVADLTGLARHARGQAQPAGAR